MIIKRGPFKIEIRKGIFCAYFVAIYHVGDFLFWGSYTTHSNAIRGAKRAVIRLYSDLLNLHTDIIEKRWK